MPHIVTKRRTIKSVPTIDECLTNPYLKKCKQLTEKKFY